MRLHPKSHVQKGNPTGYRWSTQASVSHRASQCVASMRPQAHSKWACNSDLLFIDIDKMTDPEYASDAVQRFEEFGVIFAKVENYSEDKAQIEVAFHLNPFVCTIVKANFVRAETGYHKIVKATFTRAQTTYHKVVVATQMTKYPKIVMATFVRSRRCATKFT